MISGLRVNRTEIAHSIAQAQPAADNKICKNWGYCGTAAKSPSGQCDNAKTI